MKPPVTRSALDSVACSVCGFRAQDATALPGGRGPATAVICLRCRMALAAWALTAPPAELTRVWMLEAAPPPEPVTTASATEVSESEDEYKYSVDDVFSQFKAGLERTVRREDFETHADLALAYREMGHRLDAIREASLVVANASSRAEARRTAEHVLFDPVLLVANPLEPIRSVLFPV